MDLIGILLNAVGNPYLYSIIFFLYVISASIFLPIPVEIGLFNPYIHPALLISILAIGNGCGSLIVFYIGTGVRKTVKKKWTLKSQRIKQVVTSFENFVKKYGAVGLYVFMSFVYFFNFKCRRRWKASVIEKKICAYQHPCWSDTGNTSHRRILRFKNKTHLNLKHFIECFSKTLFGKIHLFNFSFFCEEKNR